MLNEYKQQLADKGEIYLKIIVKPGANRTEVKKIMAGATFKINVAALPVKGKANQELVKFLAQEFKVFKENVKIISGIRERIKLIKIQKII